MKKIIFLILMGVALIGKAQTQIMWWNDISVNSMVDRSELIFEGRILTDSVFFLNTPGRPCTYHRILVLKQFKGDFKSDIIEVVTDGGHMMYRGTPHGEYDTYAHKDDEALFFVSRDEPRRYKISDPDLFFQIYPGKVGYAIVCNKKDPVKEVYEPIEAVTGQKYVEVHPNHCAMQPKK